MPNQPTTNPQQQGYTMPPEWAPHQATWLTWPHPNSHSFPGTQPHIIHTYQQIIQHLAPHEHIHIITPTTQTHTQAQQTIQQLPKHLQPNITLHQHPANEPWCRDHGPTFITNTKTKQKALIHWNYNAWGNKYKPYQHDTQIPKHIAQHLNIPRLQPNLTLEGGAIETNGSHILLASQTTLLNPNRNPHLSKKQIETTLKSHLNIQHILWLSTTIQGDDTDGHIDTHTRFINPTTILTTTQPDTQNPNHKPLKDNLKQLHLHNQTLPHPLHIITLPMPQPIQHNNNPLPATYANFYLANNTLLLPTYNDPNDQTAIQTLQKHLPNHHIIPINATHLIQGRGAIHCLTQQEPKTPT